jgi:hypothetical protein
VVAERWPEALELGICPRQFGIPYGCLELTFNLMGRGML